MTFIIIRGPLGVGKSTVSKHLAKILNAEYISIDAVLEKLGLDKADHYEETISVGNFIRADEHVLPGVKKLLEKGKIVIFDGCFQHKAQIEHLINSLPGPYFVFTLKASLDVCIERDSKRKRSYGRDAAAAVHKVVSRFDFGTVISTGGKTVDKTVKEVLAHVRNA
ncbi:AAA family ATPase [Candidatus Woesearchaeota archaeon]|nr:AAA family ATPase [Candidatus Woesearchaeota archaeon]